MAWVLPLSHERQVYSEQECSVSADDVAQQNAANLLQYL